jgi:Ca2+-binding RTX toxin-like protein
MYGRGGDDELLGHGAPGTTVSAVSVEAFGGAGDDKLVGGYWTDELHGGPGADRLEGADSQDRLFGDAGDDELIGGPNDRDLDDRLNGGPGNDVLDGGPGLYPDLVIFGAGEGPVTVDLAAGTSIDHSGAAGIDVLRGIEGVWATQEDDHLLGSDGHDEFQAGAGDDLIEGRGAPDYANGSLGDDRIELGAGTDRADGHDGDDVLVGADGDDDLAGGAGDDEFDGGPGRDMARLKDVRQADVFLAEDRATFRDGSAAEPLSGIEDIEGGYREDLLVGDDGDNRLVASDDSFADVLRGGGGADTMETSWDVDTVDYSLAPAAIDVDDGLVLADGHGSQDRIMGGGTLRATPFADRVDQTEGGNLTVHALGGDDRLFGSRGDDTLLGGPGSDEIAAAGGNDVVSGGAGQDRLDGGPHRERDEVTYADAPGGVVLSLAAELATADGHGSSDIVAGFEDATGSSRDDRLSGTGGANTLSGGEGADTLHGADGSDHLLGGPGDDQADAGPGNDAVGGWAGDDVLQGGEGDDTIAGSEGADTLAGGLGRDRVLFYTPGGVRVDLSAGTVDEDGHGTADRVGGVEDVDGSWHADRITGNAEVNDLRGVTGADVIRGLGGDDTLSTRDHGLLVGGLGDDRLAGSSLGGTAGYDDALLGIDADLASGTVRDGQGGTDTLVEIRHLVGSPHSDSISGSTSANDLAGAGGSDAVRGGDGNDRLTGGSGSDTLDGDAGDDALAMRDGEADTGSCGAGSDRVEADEEALDPVAADCETVERSDPGEGDGTDTHDEGGAGGGGTQTQPEQQPAGDGQSETREQEVVGPLAGARIARSRRWLTVDTHAPTVLRISLGRRIHKRCAERACVRYRRVGSMLRRVDGGRDRLALSPKWRLLRGAYRLTIAAVEGGRRIGPPVLLRFRI